SNFQRVGGLTHPLRIPRLKDSPDHFISKRQRFVNRGTAPLRFVMPPSQRNGPPGKTCHTTLIRISGLRGRLGDSFARWHMLTNPRQGGRVRTILLPLSQPDKGIECRYPILIASNARLKHARGSTESPKNESRGKKRQQRCPQHSTRHSRTA